MTLLEKFLSPDKTSLKICGVTLRDDADQLVQLGVEAMGVNFWPKSKRYLEPSKAKWLKGLHGKILRIGVFVNEPTALPIQLIEDDLIDVVQLHGDESPEEARPYTSAGIPIIKAIGVKSMYDLKHAHDYNAKGILLDANAPGEYGGTGRTFDWKTAIDFKASHPATPIILAGGICPANAKLAADTVQPAALDSASGVEISLGVKDFNKVQALLNATQR